MVLKNNEGDVFKVLTIVPTAWKEFKDAADLRDGAS